MYVQAGVGCGLGPQEQVNAKHLHVECALGVRAV